MPDTERVVDAELMRSAIRRPNFQLCSIRPAALLCIVDRVYDPVATEKFEQTIFRICRNRLLEQSTMVYSAHTSDVP